MKRLLLALSLIASPALAATYYVDCAADGDAGAGTSPAAAVAWKTIAKVNGSAFAAGDSILFKKGCTWRETLTVPSSGAAGNVITFSSYGTGAAPIISGANLVSTWTAVPTTESGGLFVDDAEDGGVTDWTGTTIVPTSTFAAGLVVNNGTYGYTATSDGANNAFGYMTVASQNDIYVRFYFKLKSDYALAATATSAIMRLRDAGATERLTVKIREDGAGAYQIQCQFPWGGWASFGTTFINRNQWYRVEIRWLVNAGAGGAQLWLDGTSLGSNFALNTAGMGITTVDVGHIVASGGVAALAGSIAYFDDIKADTSAVGPAVVAPAGVFSAACAWTPYVIEEDGTKLTRAASVNAITAVGKWFGDGANCYVRATNDADPDTHTMQVGTREFGVDVNNKDYVTVDGFTISGANENGVSIRGGSDYTTVSNSTIKNIGHHDWGVCVHVYGGTYALISGNDLSKCWAGVTVEGYYAPLPTHATIRGNTIHHTDTLGANVTKGTEGNPTDTIFESNTVYNCVQGEDDHAGLGGYYAGTGTIYRYNLIYSNGTASYRGSGINVDSHSASSQVYYNVIHGNNYGCINVTAADHFVYNNICYHNNEGAADAGELSLFTQDALEASTVTIKNNIFVASAAKHVFRTYTNNITGHVIDYNLYYGGSATPFEWNGVDRNFANHKTASSQDAHSLNVDPLLTSATDYRLQDTSPAQGKGINVSLVRDFSGTLVQSSPDAGAYETLGTRFPTTAVTITTAGNVTRYDNRH